jgi:hypothetical protein
MGAKTAALRSQVESLLAGRVSNPFEFGHHRIVETVSSGVGEIDDLTGGLPRGALTEIFGVPGAGQRSLLIASLAARTMASETCAVVDALDTFDPHTAAEAGVNLKNVLWVRCRNMDHALRATDLLIHSGGFGLIALDLSDFSPRMVRHIPLPVWFRLRRAVENTATILMAIEQEANAKTCASLVLRLYCQQIQWSQAAGDGERLRPPSWGLLFDGWQRGAEVVRSRVKAADVTDLQRRVRQSTRIA